MNPIYGSVVYRVGIGHHSEQLATFAYLKSPPLRICAENPVFPSRASNPSSLNPTPPRRHPPIPSPSPSSEFVGVDSTLIAHHQALKSLSDVAHRRPSVKLSRPGVTFFRSGLPVILKSARVPYSVSEDSRQRIEISDALSSVLAP